MAELTIVGKINYYHELGSIITQLKLNIEKKLVPLISFLVPLTGPVPAVEKCWLRPLGHHGRLDQFFVLTKNLLTDRLSSVAVTR